MADLSLAADRPADVEVLLRHFLDQRAERFEVIENAIVPQSPVAPSRKKIMAMGVGASGAFALGLVALLELLNPALRTSSQMERSLNLRPVVSIPYVRTARERLMRRLMIGATACLVLIGLPAAGWVVDRHVMPMALVAEKVADRAGLSGVLDLMQQRL